MNLRSILSMRVRCRPTSRCVHLQRVWDSRKGKRCFRYPDGAWLPNILFENVDYKRYKDLEMKVEFLGPVLE